MSDSTSQFLTSPFPVITERLVLRAFCEADLEAFAAYRADPEVARYQSWSSYSMQDAWAFYEVLASTPFGETGSWYQIAVADLDTDALLGDCALHFEEHDLVEMGFTLARAHQGRGLMREALTALLDGVFGTLGKHRVHAVTDARNDGAAKLLSALGFRKEAHFRENVLFKGTFGDEFVFACLRDEWLARRR